MALQESGIRSTQFALLVGIAKNQPVSVGNLADVLAIDSTTLTRSLRPLQKEGFVVISNRAVNWKDSRMWLSAWRSRRKKLPPWHRPILDFPERKRLRERSAGKKPL